MLDLDLGPFGGVEASHDHAGDHELPGAHVDIASDLPRRQASGLSQQSGAWLHVSAGLGTSPYTPVRFACRPEATLLTLVARPTGT